MGSEWFERVSKGPYTTPKLANGQGVHVNPRNSGPERGHLDHGGCNMGNVIEAYVPAAGTAQWPDWTVWPVSRIEHHPL